MEGKYKILYISNPPKIITKPHSKNSPFYSFLQLQCEMNNQKFIPTNSNWKSLQISRHKDNNSDKKIKGKKVLEYKI